MKRDDGALALRSPLYAISVWLLNTGVCVWLRTWRFAPNLNFKLDVRNEQNLRIYRPQCMSDMSTRYARVSLRP